MKGKGKKWGGKKKTTVIKKEEEKLALVKEESKESKTSTKEKEEKKEIDLKKFNDAYPSISHSEIEEGTKPHLNLIVIGHVDSGKSTLNGHLLFKLGHVSKTQMHRYKTDSEQIGKSSFHFAWVLDEGEEERTRGVTIDVGMKDL